MLATLALTLATGVMLGLALGRGEPRPPTYLEQLTSALALRPEQVATVESLLAAEDRDIDGWLSESLLGLRDRVAERRARTERELLAALDEEQRSRYEQLAQGDAAGASH
jgi:hypothetical protein